MACNSCVTDTLEPTVDPRWRRALWIALIVNARMFLAELAAGEIADSRALQGDALNFFGDAANYAISLGVAGLALAWRARAALLKGITFGCPRCLCDDRRTACRCRKCVAPAADHGSGRSRRLDCERRRGPYALSVPRAKPPDRCANPLPSPASIKAGSPWIREIPLGNPKNHIYVKVVLVVGGADASDRALFSFVTRGVEG